MTAKTRLAAYRRSAAEAKNPAFSDWRKNRFIINRNGWRKIAQQFTRSDNGKIYADDFNIIGEKLDDAHEITGSRTTGYYCDSFCDGVIRGAVVKLRTAKGALYIPATYCTEWDGITLHMSGAELVARGLSESCHEGAATRRAYLADSIAEREADDAREEDAKFQAEQQAESARDNIAKARAHVRELCAAIKAQRESGAIMPAICNTLISDIRRAAADIRADIRRINELKASYWLAV